MVGNKLSEEEVQDILDRMPQKPPFRFLDTISEMTDDYVVAHYTFKKDEYFWKLVSFVPSQILYAENYSLRKILIISIHEDKSFPIIHKDSGKYGDFIIISSPDL